MERCPVAREKLLSTFLFPASIRFVVHLERSALSAKTFFQVVGAVKMKNAKLREKKPTKINGSLSVTIRHLLPAEIYCLILIYDSTINGISRLPFAVGAPKQMAGPIEISPELRRLTFA